MSIMMPTKYSSLYDHIESLNADKTEKDYKYWMIMATPIVCLMALGWNMSNAVLSSFLSTIMPCAVIVLAMAIHPQDDHPNLHLPSILGLFLLINVYQAWYKWHETLNYPMEERILRNLVCITCTVITAFVAARTIRRDGVGIWKDMRIGCAIQLIFRDIYTIMLYFFCGPAITFPPGRISFVSAHFLNLFGVIACLMATAEARNCISKWIYTRVTLTLNDIADASFCIDDVNAFASVAANNAGDVEEAKLSFLQELAQQSATSWHSKQACPSTTSYGTDSEILSALKLVESRNTTSYGTDSAILSALKVVESRSTTSYGTDSEILFALDAVESP